MPKLTEMEIKETTPCLIYRDRHSRRDYSSRLIHIARRAGLIDPNRTPREIRKITNCNRIVQGFPNFYTYEGLPEPDDLNFTLCPNCGTRQDFIVALEEYHQEAARREEERERLLEEQEREGRLMADANIQAFSRFMKDVLNIHEFNARKWMAKARVGEFVVTVTKAKPEQDEDDS